MWCRDGKSCSDKRLMVACRCMALRLHCHMALHIPYIKGARNGEKNHYRGAGSRRFRRLTQDGNGTLPDRMEFTKAAPRHPAEERSSASPEIDLGHQGDRTLGAGIARPQAQASGHGDAAGGLLPQGPTGQTALRETRALSRRLSRLQYQDGARHRPFGAHQGQGRRRPQAQGHIRRLRRGGCTVHRRARQAQSHLARDQAHPRSLRRARMGRQEHRKHHQDRRERVAEPASPTARSGHPTTARSSARQRWRGRCGRN